jgi:hypothetical protein
MCYGIVVFVNPINLDTADSSGTREIASVHIKAPDAGTPGAEV